MSAAGTTRAAWVTGWAAAGVLGSTAGPEAAGPDEGVSAVPGFSQLTEAMVIRPVTLATFRLSGLSATCTSSAEAAAVVEVVVRLENSTSTLPTAGTSTWVGPWRPSVTDLPRTVSLAGAVMFAVGGPSTGQVTEALSASRPSSVVSGRPGACTSAPTRLTEAAVPSASARVTDLPTSALTSVTGPCWSTPSTLAVSTAPERCAGVCTLFSAMSTGTSTARSSRLTSSCSSAVTALAFPGEAGAGTPSACARESGRAAARAVAARAAAAVVRRTDTEGLLHGTSGQLGRQSHPHCPSHE